MFGYCYSMRETQAHNLLWQSVLLQVLRDIRDANRSHEGHKDFVTAARWVGNYPSREFNEVCMCAGLEPDFVHPRLSKRLRPKALHVKPRRERLLQWLQNSQFCTVFCCR